MNDHDWTWLVGDSATELKCGDCNCSLSDEVYFTNVERTLCLDCACLVLNAREDCIKELEEEKADPTHETGRPVIENTSLWRNSCDWCSYQDEGKHYCTMHSVQVKNMDISTCQDWTATEK